MIKWTHQDPTAGSHITRSHWPVRRPWLVAIGCALVPVALAVTSSAAVVVLDLSGVSAKLVLALGMALSAFLALAVMTRARPSLSEFGWRAPQGAGRALWFIPLVVVETILIATGEVAEPAAVVVAGVVMAIFVALSEEAWYRGLVFKALLARGQVAAVAGSTILFGLLHSASLLGGTDPMSTMLQVVFALLFGAVTALLVLRTGSLWPGVVWHAVHNAASFAAPDQISQVSGIGYAIAGTLLVGYVIWLGWSGARPR